VLQQINNSAWITCLLFYYLTCYPGNTSEYHHRFWPGTHDSHPVSVQPLVASPDHLTVPKHLSASSCPSSYNSCNMFPVDQHIASFPVLSLVAAPAWESIRLTHLHQIIRRLDPVNLLFRGVLEDQVDQTLLRVLEHP